MARFQFHNTGFHGDKYLINFVNHLAEKCQYFVETGTNVGTTLSYMIRTQPHLQFLSCEPDPEAYAHVVANVGPSPNASIFNETSQAFLQRIATSFPFLYHQNVLFWLDAHGYGFEWPLKEEIDFITRRFQKGLVLIDDFKVPGLDIFGFDVYQDQECSFEFIEGSLNPNIPYRLYYPTYTHHTSPHHPLRGWALLEFGYGSELQLETIFQNSLRLVNIPEKTSHNVIKRIIINGHPKSGNTWLVGLIGTALDGYPMQTGDSYSDVKSAQLIIDKSHTPKVSEISEKHIYIMRDFRDMMLSSLFRHIDLYHWPQRLLTQVETEDVLIEFISKLTADRKQQRPYPYPVWGENIKFGVSVAHTWVKYEDLRMNPVRELSRVLGNLGYQISQEKIAKAIKFNEFDTVKERWLDSFWAGFLRKGIVGDWKNYFSRRVGEYCHEQVGQTLAKYGYINNDQWYLSLPEKPKLCLDFTNPPPTKKRPSKAEVEEERNKKLSNSTHPKQTFGDLLQFTNNWFGVHEVYWNSHLIPWAAYKQPLKILEIGSYEGRSAVWFLTNIMAHPNSHITCVDIWDLVDDKDGESEKRQVFARFKTNIASTGKVDQVSVIKGDSKTALKGLPQQTFDLIYIDGDHSEAGAYSDSVHAFGLLKTGGMILWDDYFWSSGDTVKKGVDRACREAGVELAKYGNNVCYVKTRAVSEIVGCTPANFSEAGSQQAIQQFVSNRHNPFLISFPRSGSHWLRMLMELYFDRPTLTRTFYQHDNENFLLLHDHDMEFNVIWPDVIYLFRNPVDIIFSQINYYQEDENDLARIKYWSEQYAKHLSKWLFEENFTQRKLVIKYSDLKADAVAVLRRLAEYYGVPFDKARAQAAIAQVSKQTVKQKTKWHNPRVQNIEPTYEQRRRQFTEDHTELIWQTLLNQRENLSSVFEVDFVNKPVQEQKKISTNAIEPKSKIVGLVAGKNEERIIAQCLRALSRFTDAIVFYDDVSEDSTVKIVESLVRECSIEKIVRNTEWNYNEHNYRSRLLAAGRAIGGTHFIAMDADEMFTANHLVNNQLRNFILNLKPQEQIALAWIQLWRGVDYYRYDSSVWTNNYKPFIFCDDGVSNYDRINFHLNRTPNHQWKTYVISGYQYGVLHFQFINWRNLLVKQAWYRCLERIKQPEKSAAKINALYAPSKDETNLGVKPAPPEWFASYEFFDAASYGLPDTWREAQVLQWFNEYGRDYFADLDIWDVDWGQGIEDSSKPVKTSGDTQPLVSAIVSTYNAERFIRGCLEDLEAQTIADQLEIIVIDSGSQQNERAIVEEFQQRYNNIVYIRTEARETIYAAWNRGVKAAQGKYLTNANTDDRHRTDAFEVMVRVLEQHPHVGLVYADCLITPIPNETFENNSAKTILHWPDYSLRQALMYSIFGPQPMWRRELHQAAGYFDPNYKIAGDYEFFLRLAWRFGAFRVPEILGLYFEGEGAENQNQGVARQETARLLATYRTVIPLEDIYSALRDDDVDDDVQAAILADFANCCICDVYVDYPLAERLYRQALLRIPHQADYCNNLAITVFAQGRVDEGHRLFEQAAQLGSKFASTNLTHLQKEGGGQIHLQAAPVRNAELEKLIPLMPSKATRWPLEKIEQLPRSVIAPPSSTVEKAKNLPGFSFCIISGGQRPQKLARLIDSIHAQNIDRYEIIVAGIDMERPDTIYVPLPEEARSGQTSVLRNAAAARSQYSHLVFSDDDIILQPGWFAGVQSYTDEYDILPTKLLNMDGTRHWDWAAISEVNGQRMLDYGTEDEDLYFTSGLLMVERHVWETIRWDERLGYYQQEDVDFSKRALRAGFTVRFCPESAALHNDFRYTQVGRGVWQRSEEGIAAWLNQSLFQLKPAELIQRAVMCINTKRLGDAADCLRVCLLLDESYRPARKLWGEFVSALGGPTDEGNWFPQPIATDFVQPGEVKRSQTLAEPISLHWEGSQFVTHSLALINREIAIRLGQDPQIELSLIPYETHQFGPEVDPRFAVITEHLNRPLDQPPQVHVRHQWPPNFNPPPEGHWVVIQPWEFGSLPRKWIELFVPQVDEVWAYTTYVRDCYIRSGMPANRVHVVPPGVNTDKFHPDNPHYPLESKKKFKFLFVGGTIGRKGIDILLEVYSNTFTAADDVCLVIKDMGGKSFYQGQTAQQTIAQLQANPEAPEIEYINQTLSEEEIAGLYTACDCLVHPYRGEGFGLPIAEAMACGLPVIVTGYGAAMDFCNDKNAYLIPAREVRLKNKRIGDWETVDYPWLADPNRVVLRSTMRQVYEQPEQALVKGQQGLMHIRNNFTWGHTAAVVKQRIQALIQKPIKRLASSQRKIEPKTASPVSNPVAGNGQRLAHSVDPRQDQISLNDLNALQSSGNWPEAISLLQQMMSQAQDSEAAALWNRLGYCYVQNEQPFEAEMAFARGLELAPDNLDLLANLADLYLGQKRYEQASDYLNRALRVNPDDVPLLLSLGDCAIRLGAMDTATMAFQRVQALAPETEGIDAVLQELAAVGQ